MVTKGDKAAFLSQSLYKHGWSLFKQGLNDESLPSFAGVLDRTMLAKDTHALIPLDKLPRANRELADDTLRVMAVTFSYDDDSVGAVDRFLSAHNNPAYAPIIYSRLGDLYVEKERFQDAAAVYRAYATREPNSEFSPGLSQQAIEAYRKGGFTELVLEGKREYVALYNYGTTVLAGAQQGRLPEHRQGAEDSTSRTWPPSSTPTRRSRRRWTNIARRRAGIAPTSSPSRTIRNPSALTTCCPRRCTRARTTRAPRPSSPRPRTTIRAIRAPPRLPMPRSAPSPSTKRPCRPRRRSRRTNWPSMPA